jgi:N-acetylneuraminic acid mutarotase
MATQAELRGLLRSISLPTDGSTATLVQRLAAFLRDDGEATGDDDAGNEGPSASEAAALETAGADTELEAWRAATTRLREQRATLKATAATARAVLHQHRVRHNEQSCPLLQLVGQEDLRPTFMRAEVWGVVGLWRLRGVCRAFRGWARAELSSLPRVVAVGGLWWRHDENDHVAIATASVESLDLSTMRWSAAGCMPSLPDPRAWHSVRSGADGRVVVCGGWNHGAADEMANLASTALQWLPGTGAWSALPGLPAGRISAASVRLPDGRTMLIGGLDDNDGALASVLVLAADGSGWSDLPPLVGTRVEAATALLPDGKVLVAGGRTGNTIDTALNTAELWDPATQKWTALPPMAHKRTNPAACVLPSGRVAVVGGSGTDGKTRKDGEVFDPVKREWEPLGAEMAHRHSNISAVAVAGGLVVVSSLHGCRCDLYDEESGRWVTLPHAMAEKLRGAGLVSLQGVGLVSVPAAALTAAAAR